MLTSAMNATSPHLVSGIRTSARMMPGSSKKTPLKKKTATPLQQKENSSPQSPRRPQSPRLLTFSPAGFVAKKTNTKTRSKLRNQTQAPATANLYLTAFQREKVYLEFKNSTLVGTTTTGTLTIHNPSQDTSYIVTFDRKRSDDNLDVLPDTLEIPAQGHTEVTVTFLPSKSGNFRGKLYFKTSSRLRLEVIVSGTATSDNKLAAKVDSTSTWTSRNVPKQKKTVTSRIFQHVPGQNKAPLDPKLQKILQSCGQLGVPVIATKKVTQPKAFALSTSRRSLTVVDDVPEENTMSKKRNKTTRKRSTRMTTTTTTTAPSVPIVPFVPPTSSLSLSALSSTKTHRKHRDLNKTNKTTTKTMKTIQTNKTSKPTKSKMKAKTTHVKKHTAPKRLKLQRKSKKTAPPAGSTNALRTNAVVRSRHAQIRRVLYDENWAEKQSVGFTAYLNAVFYPAEDALDVTDSGDSASVSSSAVAAPGGGAPAAAKDYFRTLLRTQRQASIRRRAFRIYQSRDMDNVCFSIDKEVSKGGMAVRKDRELHADLGQRKRVMDLMFCYHPVWLRLGLETVFGEIVPMRASSAKDAGRSVLKKFMRHRLLNDPDTASKFRTTKTGTFGKGYGEQLSKLTLRRFLMVVLFLDRAKQETQPETIEGGPCLFNKMSPFKTSRDIVGSFAKDFLSGEGDVHRHLSLLGFDVTYKQSILDEINYTTTELSIDLRDGVRLCRLVEIMCPQYGRSLSTQLRMPGKYSKRRRSNVAVIIEKLIFISSFFFYCLLLNHSFQTNPNKITNCLKLFSLFTTLQLRCSCVAF